MNISWFPFTILGVVVFVLLVMILAWHIRKNVKGAISRIYVLNMLKAQNMSGNELINALRGRESEEVSTELLPVMLVKLQHECLIQRTVNNRYVITTEGMESLRSLNSTTKELRKFQKIADEASMVSKFIISQIIDRVRMIADIDYETDRYNLEKEQVGKRLQKLAIYGKARDGLQQQELG